MNTQKTKLGFGDFAFVLQISLAWWFTIPQVIRSFKSTAGMTITWSMFCTAFVLVNLFLALGAYKQSKSRKALQVVLVYINWLALWFTMLISLSFNVKWMKSDSVLTILVIISLAILLVLRRRESLIATISEPITRGLVSLIVKSVPQLYIAYCIIHAGSNTGLAGITLAIGHATVCLRAIEIYIAAKENGWNRNNIGLFISETGNESTWLITTIAWIAYNH